VFGAGGSTSSYREVEETDVVLLWGSNARETHPIFFHHLLKGVRRGARLISIDPRRTSSAEWADLWLGLDVGTDILMANAMGREIIAAGLANDGFVRRATSGFEAYRASVEPYTLERAARETGVPAAAIREAAHAYATADRAMICWTLGITEHHNAVDNVLALINLSLLTGHVGRWGSGLNPLRGQNNVQGGGDMGALPDRLPGFQHVENDELRAPFDRAWGVTIPPKRGLNLTAMYDAMERGELTAAYCMGENPVQSEADSKRTRRLLEGLELLVVQDIFLTATAELADVVLPAAAAWAETEGTVTNSERRVQRVRKALDPPGDARDDLWIIFELARRLGHDWGEASAEAVWDELRTLSPAHAGISYARLEAEGGLQWPCYDETHPGEPFLHSRLWADPMPGLPVPFVPVEHDPPIEPLDHDYPVRLTTGRRLDSFNTGVQSGRLRYPRRNGETLDLSPEDIERMGLAEGEVVRVVSRRGSVEAPVRAERALRPGLAFMTFHFQDDVATNLLTIDATDPKSGTAEFKSTAIRIEKLGSRAPAPTPTPAG
jgi:predicted molibdopterin-dependent oxidoreductase YjgC